LKKLFKNFAGVMLVLAVLVTSLTLLSACDFNYYYEISVGSSIYDEGAQEVSIYFSNANASTTFKTTISTDDITFEGDLSGRTAESISIVNGTRITVTLGGQCSVSTSSNTKNRIVVSGNATSDGRTYACVVSKVLESGLTVTDHSNSVVSNVGTFTSVFKTTSGATFDEDNITEAFITLTNDNSGNADIDVTFDSENQMVTVTVSNFSVTDEVTNPIVKFLASTTSLEKDILVTME
jgi:hypothetical protein